MKAFFRACAESPREVFEAFVYIAGSIVAYVLSSRGHMVAAIIQAIIVVGTMYGAHCAAEDRRDYKRVQEDNKKLKHCCFYAERKNNILERLLTEEQKKEYYSKLTEIPSCIDE